MIGLWILVMLGVVIGAFQFMIGIALATSAPQQAAQAAMALAWAVLPYVFVRAIDGIVRNERSAEMRDLLRRLADAADANVVDLKPAQAVAAAPAATAWKDPSYCPSCGSHIGSSATQCPICRHERTLRA
jgi:hypothetical protein